MAVAGDHPQRWRAYGAADGGYPQRWRVSVAAVGGYPQRWRESGPLPVLILNAGG
ncbi:TPA: hypothetical protein MCI46_004150 [Klebsiella pneumoniae]|nr:hypothetical protein [Klebsiella pneumoniae]HBT7180987.1 hypothetical protein [Klebsiella pneumoniae]HDO7140094.1 hypothetical protein [Klebsiella pneumoniae]